MLGGCSRVWKQKKHCFFVVGRGGEFLEQGFVDFLFEDLLFGLHPHESLQLENPMKAMMGLEEDNFFPFGAL